MDKSQRLKQKRKNYAYGIMGLLLVSGVIGGLIWAFYPGSILNPLPDDAPDTTKLTSTFTLIDYRTGEDVTAWVEISVWIPNESDLPFDEDDPYIIGNFDDDVSSKDAADVAIDLRDHAVFWLEIDPDFESDYGGYNNGAYNVLTTRDMRKGTGGTNYDYRVSVYHAPSNVSIAMLTQGVMRSGASLGDARPYNNTFTGDSVHNLRGTDGNYTIYLNMPIGSTDAYHAGSDGGDEWDIDDEELDTMIENAQADYLQDEPNDEMGWLQDQSNHRSITPYYDIEDDDNHNFNIKLERYTNCFAVKFGFNASASTTDGHMAQVNLTVIERDGNTLPIEVVYDAEIIWLIFYEPITCYNNLYNFDIEINFGTGIWLGNVTTVRVETPDDDDNIGNDVTLSEMYLVNYAKCP